MFKIFRKKKKKLLRDKLIDLKYSISYKRPSTKLINKLYDKLFSRK